MASRLGTNKGRVEKGRGGTSATTPVVHDIIPGKFNDLDWQQALYVEETDNFIGGLVQGIADACLETIYRNYLEKQLIPFTVSMAKDAIVQLVEWTFINPDDGEPDILLDPTWTEDCEADSYVVDSWAQGALTKRPCDFNSTHPPTSRTSGISARLPDIHEEVFPPNDVRNLAVVENSGEIHSAEEVKESSNEDQILDSGEPLDGIKDDIEETATDPQVPKPPLTKKEPFIPGWSQRPRPVRYKPYTGRISSAGLKGIVEPLEKTEQRLDDEDRRREKERLLQLKREKDAANAAKAALRDSFLFSIQTGDEAGSANQSTVGDMEGALSLDNKRPQGSVLIKGVEQTSSGANALAKRTQTLLNRLNPEQLPQHKVKIHYRVVDSDVDAFNARLEAMKKGRPFLESTSGTPSMSMTLSRRTGGFTSGGPMQPKSMAGGRLGEKLPPLNPQPVSKREDALIDPLPNSMIDTINLANGVVAKQGGRVRRGPKQNDANNLLPDPNSDSLKVVRPFKRDNSSQMQAVIDEANIILRSSLEPPTTFA